MSRLCAQKQSLRSQSYSFIFLSQRRCVSVADVLDVSRKILEDLSMDAAMGGIPRRPASFADQ